MKIKYGILLALLLVACIVAPASAAGGSGTASDPYRIQTAAELQSINNNLGAYYILMNDIDLSGRTWTPIGTSSVGFHGSFDGNGKIIKNLALSSTSQSAGFFGGVTSGAVIKDVTFQDCTVTSTSSWCGVVIGSIIMSSSAHETAVISNVDCVRCSASASSYCVGCLVGLIYTSAVVEIVDCEVSYSEAESASSAYVGCLVGDCAGASSTEITRCDVLYSHARASSNNVGCLVGWCIGASSLVIDSSTAQNSIAESASSDTVGCLVGRCAGASSVNALNCDVVNCLAKGTNYVGGLYGMNWEGSFAASDCTVTGCTIVATSNYAGGIAGRIVSGQVGTFSDCTVTDSTIIASGYAAGVCPAYS